ncbi:MAG: DEAD/DEAH box helicase [Leptospiraceae bacterium]|nr:DEAD/DEAH box helicase [Leptospiraceae bacterium]
MSGFSDFAFSPALFHNIATAGFSEPTPIQRAAIPLALAGNDILGLAQTGTGKTAAFCLPLLQRLSAPPRSNPVHPGTRKVRALIVAPTRELAEQIHEVILSLGKALNLRSTTIYGGASMNRQLSELRRGVDIVVACPGRLIDHMDRKSIDLGHVETLVLDEADQMFDMGFLPGIRKIVAALSKERQTMLFSATMPDEIRKLSFEILKDPKKVELERGPVATINHALYPVSQEMKTSLLLHLLKTTGSGPILVFTKTKHKASRLADQIAKAGFKTAALQGNLSQNQRARSLDGFRSGKYQILVATDIAARGIDVNDISHIINYDVPATGETYIHRIGRTARATKSGDAYTFVTGDDKRLIRDIEKALGKPIERRMLADFDYKGSAPVIPETVRAETQAKTKNAQKPQSAQSAPQRAAGERPKKAGKPRRRRFRGFGR